MTAAPYQLLPDLAPDDLRRLTESIVANGVEVPVIVDENGDILDGHHRQMIADSLGIECPRIVRSGLSEHQKRIYAAEMNLARRQLTDAQKANVGMVIEPDIAAEAKRRSLANLRQNDSLPIVSIDTIGREGLTPDVVAETVGINSGSTYRRHKELLMELAKEPDGEQLMKHIDDGDWDIKDARQELKRRHAPVRAADPVAKSDQAEQEPAPQSKPSPNPLPPSISAATAMLNLANLPTANVAEAGDYLFDMAKDIDGYLDGLPEIISTMKRVARRARHLRDKPLAQETA